MDYLFKIPPTQSWILDGFPRTDAQAQFLMYADLGITHVIELSGNQEEVTKRLTSNLYDPVTKTSYNKLSNPPPFDVAPRCIRKPDDEPAAVAERLKAFNESAD